MRNLLAGCALAQESNTQTLEREHCASEALVAGTLLLGHLLAIYMLAWAGLEASLEGALEIV